MATGAGVEGIAGGAKGWEEGEGLEEEEITSSLPSVINCGACSITVGQVINLERLIVLRASRAFSWDLIFVGCLIRFPCRLFLLSAGSEGSGQGLLLPPHCGGHGAQGRPPAGEAGEGGGGKR